MNFLPFSPHLPLMAVELGISGTGIESHTENSAATGPAVRLTVSLFFGSGGSDLRGRSI